MPLATLIFQGGPVMVVLLALSVFATAIILLKTFELLRLRLEARRALAGVSDLLTAGREDDAARMLASSRHPIARALTTALRVGSDPSIGPGAAEAEVQRVGSAEIRALESWMRGLSAIGHLSPLLGLLGTVLGMIAAFMSIEDAGPRVDPALLSGGIWEALLTTAFGLTIAIPCMAAFYVIEGEVDRIRAVMRDECAGVLLRHGKLAVEAGSGATAAEDRAARTEQAFGV